MKTKTFILLCVILALILVIGGGLLYMSVKSLGFSVGRVLSADGRMILVLGDSPVVMSNRMGRETPFDGLSDGDKVLVLHDGVAESYPGQTGVYALFKLSDGSIADISDGVLIQLTELGWRTETKLNLPEKMPDDFSFALTWGCYGISSYDSRTGKLVKTTDATHPEDYVTAYTMSAEELARVYATLRALEINEYPLVYDPQEGGVMSRPTMTLILTVRTGSETRTVKAENIALIYESKSEKGQRFLDACRTIHDMLTATEAWQALPDYEFLYE
ncbi:MAG: hypothetical protein IKL84_05855 [Clostridia bacterium]|nr:hypothetical protein [Clostridia bacterium]